jgi:adenylate cyclase
MIKPRRLIIFAAIAIAVSALTVFLYSKKIDFFYAIDLKLKDVRFRTRGEIKPDSRVVIVAVDEKSVKEIGRWPWDRKIIARLIENLEFYGAKSVALDIVFSEPSNKASDKALADSMNKGNNVIAGYFFRQDEGGQSPVSSELLQPSKIKILKIAENVTEVPIIAYPVVETNIPVISNASASAGFFNIIPDKDGNIRTANLLMLYDGEVYPSLALSALRHNLGNEIVLDIAIYGVDGLLIGDRRIPVDESGRLTLNYYGKQGIFKTIPATDVINKRLNKDALKDAIVFIGATEIGISDVRVTPLDPVLPGVEIHATVASNVLQNNFLIRDGRVMTLEIAFILFFPVLLSILSSLVRRTIISLIFFSGVMAVYLYVNYILFASYFLNIGIIFPIISIGMAYLGFEAYRNLIEERQGRFLKKAFTNYVSPDLVGEIMKNPDMLKLGGEKKEITVLFSDIRGFTTVSEKLTPESLVLLLNHYLGPMTDIVLQHRGTLDKYIGDAIMALYNAPLNLENHSFAACHTAMDMIAKLKELNNEFKEKGLPEINIGIGINTGYAIVGNMGTDVRFDYTAIGDTINLASRLEGMNKVYKTHIVVSEFVINHLRSFESGSTGTDTFRFRELDVIKVKGKDKPVTIYELLPNMDETLKKKFEDALKLYKQQQFKDALNIFESLVVEFKDNPSSIFAERCSEFIKNPPEADWDGVYVAKTK